MLTANAFTTPERLAGFMGIDTPTGVQLVVMQNVINNISQFVETYTKRKFKKQVISQEIIAAEKGQTLNLKNFPISNSDPILLERRTNALNEDSWETVDQRYYTVDFESGIIQFMASVTSFRGRDNYRVSYTAGYDFDNVTTFLSDTEVGDIEMAVWIIASDAMSSKAIGGNIRSERIGDYSVTYAGVSGLMFNNPQAKSILDQYADSGTLGPLTPLQM